MSIRTIVYVSLIAAALGCKGPVHRAAYEVERVAASPYQWTGMAISKENRMFVNYPTWTNPAPFKVAELVDGQPVAYPNDSVNALFTCVQSVVVDGLNRLWVLDPANPRFEGVVEGGAKLFMIDLASDSIVRTYGFPEEVAPKDSYLNDVRVDTQGGVAYMTDSQLGGIVVLDLNTGKSWRALDASCAAVRANLDGIEIASTGKWTNIVHSDGIELSKDGATLYFMALTGNLLHQVPTAALRDTSLSVERRCSRVSVLNGRNVPSDGMWLKNDTLYMADLAAEGLYAVDVKTGRGGPIALDQKLRWADSFAEDAQGNVFFTTAQINYPREEQKEFEIFKIKRKR